ncbi:glycosyltransferase [Oceanobacillus sp. CFH 90083]|uniref:glycosyltransferase family protein n=1 Tax=Oceanobacillus sp. CFH 90083 TaxID=2592336 RepID=UPI00128C6B7F|nr:glycosyltransferase [Oceanobacillus sp. CFH 90083]
MKPKKILMCYGKTSFTPGRYLEDAFQNIGVKVDVYPSFIDFSTVTMEDYIAVLFVESPALPPVKVKHIEFVSIPKLFLIHHGENRLATNKVLAQQYQPDLILMAHSLHLAKHFPIPVKFFPFAMAKNVFNDDTLLQNRPVDITSVGTLDHSLYQKRVQAIEKITKKFHSDYQLSFHKRVFLHDLASAYGQSKIVFNHAADTIKSLNFRIFEGIGCGALVLSDKVPKLDTLLEDGRHLVLFDSHQDLLEKIEYYLTHVDEAQVIASAGYQHLLKYHTYEHRAEMLLEWIKKGLQPKRK